MRVIRSVHESLKICCCRHLVSGRRFWKNLQQTGSAAFGDASKFLAVTTMLFLGA